MHSPLASAPSGPHVQWRAACSSSTSARPRQPIYAGKTLEPESSLGQTQPSSIHAVGRILGDTHFEHIVYAGKAGCCACSRRLASFCGRAFLCLVESLPCRSIEGRRSGARIVLLARTIQHTAESPPVARPKAEDPALRQSCSLEEHIKCSSARAELAADLQPSFELCDPPQGVRPGANPFSIPSIRRWLAQLALPCWAGGRLR